MNAPESTPVARAVAALRREAAQYAAEDSSPGPLATAWGWQTIARTVRRVADQLERESAQDRPGAAEAGEAVPNRHPGPGIA